MIILNNLLLLTFAGGFMSTKSYAKTTAQGRMLKQNSTMDHEDFRVFNETCIRKGPKPESDCLAWEENSCTLTRKDATAKSDQAFKRYIKEVGVPLCDTTTIEGCINETHSIVAQAISECIRTSNSSSDELYDSLASLNQGQFRYYKSNLEVNLLANTTNSTNRRIQTTTCSSRAWHEWVRIYNGEVYQSKLTIITGSQKTYSAGFKVHPEVIILMDANELASFRGEGASSAIRYDKRHRFGVGGQIYPVNIDDAKGDTRTVYIRCISYNAYTYTYP